MAYGRLEHVGRAGQRYARQQRRKENMRETSCRPQIHPMAEALEPASWWVREEGLEDGSRVSNAENNEDGARGPPKTTNQRRQRSKRPLAVEPAEVAVLAPSPLVDQSA